MTPLLDPILQDCARLVERHTGISGEFKVRLLNGLAQIDAALASMREPIPAEQPQPIHPKGGKR
jgi:hypothetical protein